VALPQTPLGEITALPTSTFNFKKNSGGYTPGLPLKKGGEGEEKEEAREASPPPPIHIPGYATVLLHFLCTHF